MLKAFLFQLLALFQSAHLSKTLVSNRLNLHLYNSDMSGAPLFETREQGGGGRGGARPSLDSSGTQSLMLDTTNSASSLNPLLF